MEIVKYPHPALRWKSKPITKIDAQLREIVRKMFAFMYEGKGIGLAANQVALPYRFFVVNVTTDPNVPEEEHVFINPEIVRRKGSAEGEEGCLSFPDLYGPVRRAEKIVVEAFDLSGEEFQMELTDLPARVVQHEADHLDGILFIDRMTDSSRRELEPSLSDFEAHFQRQQTGGLYPPNEQMEKRLRELERQLCG